MNFIKGQLTTELEHYSLTEQIFTLAPRYTDDDQLFMSIVYLFINR